MTTDITKPADPPVEPAPTTLPLWTRGDTNAFFGLGFNILVNVLTLTGLILGTMVTFILEKKFVYAAIASCVGAVLSFIGLIHAPEVAWAANPQVALGYVFFGIVCLAYSFLPGANDPVEIDEADTVAGR